MNKRMQKVIALFSLVALLASLIVVPREVSAATNVHDFYSEYTDVAKIYDYDSCPSIQGIAVGSQKIYTVKTGGDDTKAFISMSDKDTGETVKLTNAATGGYIFDYLNHANDMDVWGIDGKSNIFVATTLQGAEGIVRLRRDDTTLTKVAAYHLKCNGEDICATAMGVMGVSDGKIHFITKWAMQLYTGSVDVNATGNVTIEMTMLCSITKSRAYIQGQYVNLSNFVNQGMGYHDGTLFLPISGDDSQLNSSVILVFDLNNITPGDIVYPSEALVFRVDSKDYSALFELESCDICTADNKLYFGVQRRVTTSDTNHDGIASFDGYTYSRLPVDASTSEPDSSLPGYTVRYNANGGTGTMADTWVPYGYSTNLRTNTFTKDGYKFAGWTAYRTAQNQWYYTDGSSSKWYKEGSQPSGWTKSIYKDAVSVAQTTAVNGDVVMLYAQWTAEEQTFTIRYDANGGEGVMGDTVVTYGVSTPLRNNTYYRNGWDFGGWTAYRTTQDMWYYTNGSKSAWYKEGQQPSGYTKYIYGNANKVAATSSIDKDVVIMYAQWTPKDQTYTVQYNANGGTGSMQDTVIVYGYPIQTRPNTFTKTGHKFAGWNIYRTSQDQWYYTNGTDAGWYKEGKQPSGYEKKLYANQVTLGQSSAVDGDTVILYAQWTPITYTVRYDANGGSGSMADTQVTYGVSTKLRANTFTRPGYEFVGWYGYRTSENKWLYINSDGSADGWYVEGQQPEGYVKDIYKDQTAIARSTTVDGEVIVMYAKWEASGYVVIFQDDDGTVLKTDVLDAGAVPVAPATPVKASDGVYKYTFAGWSPAIGAVSGNVTYTATYTCEVVPPKIEPITPTAGMLEPYLERVGSASDLEEGVPYVISDYKSSWLHYVLTAEKTQKVDGSLTHKGLLLDGTPSVDETNLWYIKNGNLVYGSADSNHYLLISCDPNYEGTVEIGSYDATNAAYLTYDSTDNFIIRSKNAYLNRHGGSSTDFIATAFYAVGGSYWHLDRLVRGQIATVTLSAPESTVLMGKTLQLTPTVKVDGIAANDYVISWSVDKSSAATVSADGTVTALKCGRVTVTATLTSVNGHELLIPTTASYTINIDHNYKASVVKPTCTEAGYTTYTCSCGHSYTADEVAALGHKYNAVITTAPGCDSAGVKTFTCENCGDVYTEALAATGHHYKSTVTAPTCTENGYTTYTCACGHSYTADEVAALGHKYETVTVDATCTADGSVTDTCTVCGDTKTEVIPATGHSYNTVVTAPTCTEAGYTTYTCSCGHSYTADEVAALGHKYETVTVDATCTADGSVTDTCTVCGDTKTEVIPATGHTYESVVTAPTCTKAGYTTYTCSCGHSYTADEVAALGHKYETVTVDATCTADGSVTDTCTVCGDTKVEVIPATGHSYNTAVTAPTCTEAGYTTYTCACGHSYTADEVAALGHKYETVTVDATCIADGSVTDTCTVCGDTKTEVIPATGHTYESVVTAPTCTKAGYTTYTCACGHSYTANEVAALGHKYNAVITTAPGCDSAGVKTFTCENCGDVYTEALAATGHHYKPTVTAPTCTENGYTTYACPCGHSYTADEVAALGHKYETVTVDATCTADGSVTDTCTVCGDTKVEVISATGHSYNTVVTAPTCTEAGYTTYTCACGHSYTADEVAALGHKYETVTVDATCTADGSVTDTCTVCGDTKTEVIPATGHSYNTVVTAPTCTEAGYTTYTCSCGHSYTADEVAALGHKYETVTVDATCTADGSVTDTCTVCGDTKVEVIPATGHSYNTVVTAPTCTEAGYTTYTCACGHSYTADEVAALGHKYETVTVDATCTADGSITDTCTVCSDTKTEVIPATGHTAGDWVVIKEPTPTEDGLQGQYCTVCSELLASEVIIRYVRGICGDSMTWYLDLNTGLLTITGTGEMYDENAVPWYKYTEVITAVQIEEGVETLRDYAFNECTALTKVELPATLKKIGDYAFFECAVLTQITLPEGLTELGSRAFTNCRQLSAIEIPQGITVIGASTFAGCTALATVTLPEGVTVLDAAAFSGCQSLTELTLPDTLTTIGDRGLYKCTSLTTLTIPAGVNAIGSNAFYTNVMESITFLGDAPTLAEDAFGNLTATVYYPAGNETWTDVAGKNYGGAIRWKTWANAVVKPTLALKVPTLEFKDMITVNVMFTAENIDDVVEMGMLTYTEKVDTWSVETANHVIPGTTYDVNTGRYIAHSQGIHAKYLGDSVYMTVYAKLTDGSYVYCDKIAPYSPVQYATNQLNKSTDMKLKQLCAAMLNYGAEAQLFFGHNTDNLANASLTAEQKALPEAYNVEMTGSVPAATLQKQGIFANNKGFAKRTPSISFEGAFCINYFFTPAYAPVDGITMYYWTEADYNATDVLTVENASGSFQMEGQGVGQYRGDITGIAAKALSEAVYVAAIYSDGTTTWTSGVLGYSIGSYCASQISKGADVAGLAEATAVYGYHAKQFFGL